MEEAINDDRSHRSVGLTNVCRTELAWTACHARQIMPAMLAASPKPDMLAAGADPLPAQGRKTDTRYVKRRVSRCVS